MKTRTTLLTLFAVCLMIWSCDDGSTKVADPVCGNDVAETGEACDGDDFAGMTCTSFGQPAGQLFCTDQCTLDLSGCRELNMCGDGIRDAEEACEDGDFGDMTCASFGMAAGDLVCTAECTIDAAGCHDLDVCGNGIMETGEACDGVDFGTFTCASFGFDEGTLICSEACTIDTSACAYDQPECGNEVVESGEDCDGANLDAQTCLTLGYGQASGALGCTAACAFDETACVAKSANADLATLTVSSGTLTPAFSASRTSYTLLVLYEVSALTLTAAAADPWATVSITPGQPIALAEGANPVTVIVTAEDLTQKSYAVMVTRSSASPNIGTLIYVPTGTFQRDATATNLSVVSAFRMSRYEITRAQWVTVTGWPDPSEVTFSSGLNDPVQMVSRYDAVAFCNKLSMLEGLTPVYTVSGVDFNTLTYEQIPTANDATWNAATANWSASGYRLPTEMEWMWAAMGADTANPGAVNTNGYAKAFAGSTGTNAIGDYAVFGYDFSGLIGRTTTERSNPVGSKLSNELGFHDLTGNVWELTWDMYGLYPAGLLVDYRGPTDGFTTGIIRGCDWRFGEDACYLAQRGGLATDDRYYLSGLRVVRP